MELIEQSVIDSINIMENGVIQIRRADKILKDGTEVSKTFHRYCLAPGEDLTGEDPKVIAVANAVWSPEVITAYKDATQVV